MFHVKYEVSNVMVTEHRQQYFSDDTMIHFTSHISKSFTDKLFINS